MNPSRPPLELSADGVLRDPRPGGTSAVQAPEAAQGFDREPSGHALVIDDDTGVRRAMTATLMGLGWEVTAAASGADGLALLDPDRCDVVLLDVMMPEVDGITVCRTITSQPSTAHIPVILITALQGREAQMEGLKAGAVEFLTKPVATVELAARLRTALRLRQSHRRVQQALTQQRRMLRMLVHDFRSPLSVITTNARLCLLGLPLSQHEEVIADVMAASQKALRMVDEVVALARSEDGRLRLHCQTADIAALIDQVLAPHQHLEPARGLVLRVVGAPVAVRLDPLLIERVLDNLVGNALKYSQQGSPVGVELTFNAERLRIEVLDRGVGLGQLDPERLFAWGEVGLGLAITRQGGLGLAFSRLAVEAHGGVIGLRPRAGGGTCAWLELPIQSNPEVPVGSHPAG